MRQFIFVSLMLLIQACSHGSSLPDAPATPLTVQSYAASEKGVHVTSTLVLGEQAAILIDAQFIKSEASQVVEMIRASGRTLEAIYITHGHPDHSFGLPVIQAAFPEARVLAHPSVIEEMKATWQAKHDQWKPLFKEDLADTRVEPLPYDDGTLSLEGQELQLIGPLASDSAHSVSVYVPSARTLIAGDASYAGTHVWLADTTEAGWDAWLGTLRQLASLEATTVISGHQAPSRAQSPADLTATAEYIAAFKRSVAESSSAEQVVAAMSAKYPSLKLPIILQISAGAAMGQ